MPQYVQNPPKVEAVQWDGTLESAREIQAFITKHDKSRRSFHIKTYFHHGDDTWSMRDYLEFDGPIPGSRDKDDNRFYSGDYLVYWPGNVLEVMSKAKFEREFREVYEDDGARTAD